MFKFLIATAVAGLVGAAAAVPALPADRIPDLSSNNTAWNGGGVNEFTPPKSGPGPVQADPAHPYVSDFRAERTGEQPNSRVADLTNPILLPWVREALRSAGEFGRVNRGFTRESRCWPTGVPAMLLNPGRLHFVQTPKEVWILQEADHRVRRIYLDQPHSDHPQPSWYGESVGHYEGGDTLVVDTIGLNDKSFVDSYRTPHTDRIHVVERFKLIDGGRGLEVNFTVDDPGAFTIPWSASKSWRRVSAAFDENVCAENNDNYFHYNIEPMPHAGTADF